MKTAIMLTLSVLLAIFTVNNAFAGVAIKIGFDLEGDHDVSGEGESWTEDVDTGISVSGEVFTSISNNFDIGGGITYQFPRSLSDFAGDFNFVPLYGMARLKFSEGKKVTPYVVGQLGYSFYFGDSDYEGSADLEGDIYYAIGGGVIFDSGFLLEVLYSVSSGTYDVSEFNVELDIEYSVITIAVGYVF
jgi:hypothetical protein